MSVRALLAELEAAGVHLTRRFDDLRYRTEPGISIGPYRERIQAHKHELVAELRGPVEATVPPAAWDGTLPEPCAWPHVCQILGPCPRYPDDPCRLDDRGGQ